MTQIAVPVSVYATRIHLIRLALFLGMLWLCTSAAATRVERCQTVGADFRATDFISNFATQSHSECKTETLAVYALDEVWNRLR